MRFFIVLFIFAAASVAAACSSDNAVRNLKSPDFAKVIENEGVFLLDVHVPEQEHINGTDAFIPYNELGNNADKLPADKNMPIAVYCRSGSMSAEAAETLRNMGYTRIYNLDGGINAWKEHQAGEKPEVALTLMKSATCGCCSNYGAYLEERNFEVESVNVKDMAQVKRRHGITSEMESCHTAIIGGYFVEGHVPAEAVKKLLDEKPDVDGISLPGMPMGSPGMVGLKSGDFVVYSLSGGKPSEFMRI